MEDGFAYSMGFKDQIYIHLFGHIYVAKCKLNSFHKSDHRSLNQLVHTLRGERCCCTIL